MSLYTWLGTTGDLEDENNYSPTGTPGGGDLLIVPSTCGASPIDGDSFAGLVYLEAGAGVDPGETGTATFHGTFFNAPNASISGGVFLGTVVSPGAILGGVFPGAVVLGTADGIYGGTFAAPVFDFNPSVSNPEGCTFTGGYFSLADGVLNMTDCLAGNILTGKTIAGVDGAAAAGPTAEEIADAVLSRDVSHAEAASGRTCLATLVLAAVNKANTEDNAGYLTVYRTDGLTEHTRIPISASPGAAPIEGIG
jgi:hypothetical protein